MYINIYVNMYMCEYSSNLTSNRQWYKDCCADCDINREQKYALYKGEGVVGLEDSNNYTPFMDGCQFYIYFYILL